MEKQTLRLNGTRANMDHLADVINPILLAVLLAVVSLPVVALAIDVPDMSSPIYPRPQLPASDLGRWSAALGSVLAAALVAGAIGAPIVRVNRIFGGFATLTLAWFVAIAALPVLPALLHLGPDGNLQLMRVCIDTCDPKIESRDLESGLRVACLFWIGPLFAPIPFLTLLAGVVCWTRSIKTTRPSRPG